MLSNSEEKPSRKDDENRTKEEMRKTKLMRMRKIQILEGEEE